MSPTHNIIAVFEITKFNKQSVGIIQDKLNHFTITVDMTL